MEDHGETNTNAQNNTATTTFTMAMDYINPVFHGLNTAVEYLRANAWHIVLLLGAGWFLKTQVLDYSNRNSMTAYRLSDDSGKSRNRTRSTTKKNHRDDDMRRIRQKQQEELDRQAREAAATRKKEEESKPQKKPKPKKPVSQAQPRQGYNPMQPWTASGGGGGYKPQRRTVRRG